MFNGWNQIKSGAPVGQYSTHGIKGQTGVAAPNKRVKKITDKEKEKEKIYQSVIKDESHKRQKVHDKYKIDYIQQAERIASGKSTRATRGTTLSSSNNTAGTKDLNPKVP